MSKKRYTTMVLAVLMVITMLPVSAFAEALPAMGGGVREGIGDIFSGWGTGYSDVDTGSAQYSVTAGETVDITSEEGTSSHSWSSDNTAVATVSGSGKTGTVRGVAAGTATITHSYKKNSSAKSETFTVTVEAAPVEKELYFTSSHKGRKARSNESVTMTAHVSGYEEYDYEIVWQYSEDEGKTFTDAGIGETYTFKMTKENAGWIWRFKLVER